MATTAAAVATAVAVNFTDNLTATNVTGNDTLPHDQLDFDLYEVPTLLVVVLSVLYGSISVIAVAGNGLVIWAIATSKRMRSVTNHYLANLAFADILIALFAVPFEVSATDVFCSLSVFHPEIASLLHRIPQLCTRIGKFKVGDDVAA